MKIILILIIFSLVFVSCYSHEPSSNDYELIEKYFPLKIGNKWEYSFEGVGENAILERIIKNNTTHEDGSKIWGYTEAVKVNNPNPNEPIAGYFTLKSDGFYFYSSAKDTMFPGTNILCKKQLLLKPPISVGTQWETTDGFLCRIAKIGTYKVLDTNYKNTVLVISERNQGIDSSWYSPNVGLVKHVQSIQHQSSIKWELRDCSLLE